MRTYTQFLERLRSAGLRPTRQRLALSKLLFENGDRHVTAEVLHSEAQSANMRVSLATVYNTLHQFTKAGLLREIVIGTARSYFDTNTNNHHHFYHENSGLLEDIDGDTVSIGGLPEAPAGVDIKRIDIVVRVA